MLSQKNNYENKKIKSSVFYHSVLSFFILSHVLVTRNQLQAKLPFWATIKKYPRVTLLVCIEWSSAAVPTQYKTQPKMDSNQVKTSQSISSQLNIFWASQTLHGLFSQSSEEV